MKYFWKIKTIPLKDQDNTFERPRKYLWEIKKMLLKTKKIPLKDQEQPVTLCGRQHGSFCWSHPLHLLFFKHHFYYFQYVHSVVLLFDVFFVIHLDGWSSSRAGRTGTDEDSWMLKSLRYINHIFVITIITIYYSNCFALAWSCKEPQSPFPVPCCTLGQPI